MIGKATKPQTKPASAAIMTSDLSAFGAACIPPRDVDAAPPMVAVAKYSHRAPNLRDAIAQITARAKPQAADHSDPTARGSKAKVIKSANAKEANPPRELAIHTHIAGPRIAKIPTTAADRFSDSHRVITPIPTITSKSCVKVRYPRGRPAPRYGLTGPTSVVYRLWRVRPKVVFLARAESPLMALRGRRDVSRERRL